ncbi:YigZ family protein [Thalassotalea sp. 42_200_T64]|nr:YigZ family protein [Thalassotalea sp. 42_200_T64]
MHINSSPYTIPVSDIEVETVVNRSRFICSIKHCDDKLATKVFIEQIRQRYPDASHHCYAFISSRPEDSQTYGFSDDGEPSGTAGRPMLSVLQGNAIGEICAVVSRYFGGVKLGTGGLQRAYGNSVRQAVIELNTVEKIPTEQINLTCDYQQVKDIEHTLMGYEGIITQQDYGIEVMITASLPIPRIDEFIVRVIELTAGRVTPKRLLE